MADKKIVIIADQKSISEFEKKKGAYADLLYRLANYQSVNYTYDSEAYSTGKINFTSSDIFNINDIISNDDNLAEIRGLDPLIYAILIHEDNPDQNKLINELDSRLKTLDTPTPSKPYRLWILPSKSVQSNAEGKYNHFAMYDARIMSLILKISLEDLQIQSLHDQCYKIVLSDTAQQMRNILSNLLENVSEISHKEILKTVVNFDEKSKKKIFD